MRWQDCWRAHRCRDECRGFQYVTFVTYMHDTLQNFITGLGQAGVDPNVSTQYILNLLDRATLENMYRGDWLARKIVDAPPEDMTREWRSWQANNDQIEKL